MVDNSLEVLREFAALAGIQISEEDLDSARSSLQDILHNIQVLQTVALDDDEPLVVPSLPEV